MMRRISSSYKTQRRLPRHHNSKRLILRSPHGTYMPYSLHLKIKKGRRTSQSRESRTNMKTVNRGLKFQRFRLNYRWLMALGELGSSPTILTTYLKLLRIILIMISWVCTSTSLTFRYCMKTNCKTRYRSSTTMIFIWHTSGPSISPKLP